MPGTKSKIFLGFSKLCFSANARICVTQVKLRAEIIEAAINILSQPSKAFSLRAVATEARISAPAVYLHFKDTDELLVSVLEQLFTEKIAMCDAFEQKAIDKGGDSWQRLLARSHAYVEYALHHTGHYKVLHGGRAVGFVDNPEIGKVGRSLHTKTVALITDILSKHPDNQITQDPSRLAILLWSGLHGIVSLQINKPGREWPDAYELANQITSAIVRL
jgi:AcrR family transcriptional regulator